MNKNTIVGLSTALGVVGMGLLANTAVNYNLSKKMKHCSTRILS